MVTHQASLDSLVFPLDGEDTLDVVTIIHPDETEIRYPRLWQTPDGVIDLNDGLHGMIDQREDAKRQWEQVGAYYDARQALVHSILSKLRAVRAALEAHDEEQASAVLATLTPAEQADMEGTVRKILDEHPEWALADIWDADVSDADVSDADEDDIRD